MIKKIICIIKKHDFSLNVGSCPFTGKSYVVCRRCLGMMVENEKMD